MFCVRKRRKAKALSIVLRIRPVRPLLQTSRTASLSCGGRRIRLEEQAQLSLIFTKQTEDRDLVPSRATRQEELSALSSIGPDFIRRLLVHFQVQQDCERVSHV